MNIIDNEMILFDRLEVIKMAFTKYGIDNFALSMSGGKDSTVLHHLIDMAIPKNTIPRVFIDTGIEYAMIKLFIYNIKNNDNRVTIIKPKYSLGKIFNEYGYPFKSKEHSEKVYGYQINGMTPTALRYYSPTEERKRYGCPKILRYQFECTDGLRISKKCCDKLKKEPFKDWQKENCKPYLLTGERMEEGGARASHGDCLVVDKSGTLKKFKPLNKVTTEWIDWFIEKYNIQLCELYYEPYNFKRTGCMGCPYNLKIKDDLKILEKFLPEEYRKAMLLWKPVYQEYIRIGYRIKEDIYKK